MGCSSRRRCVFKDTKNFPEYLPHRPGRWGLSIALFAFALGCAIFVILLMELYKHPPVSTRQIQDRRVAVIRRPFQFLYNTRQDRVVANDRKIGIILPMLTLEVKERKATDSTEDLRKKGLVPAVFYGPKQDSTPISIDSRKLASVWKEAGETTLVKLSGLGSDIDTLIHDIQVHPVTGELLHADFYVLEKGKKVTITVPVEFVGSAPAEKLGGIVVKALHEVEIEVAPAELPHHLDVDLAALAAIGDHLTAKDIKLPPSAELKTDADEILVSIVEFKEEKEEAPGELKTAEIIGEKKEAAAEAESKE